MRTSSLVRTTLTKEIGAPDLILAFIVIKNNPVCIYPKVFYD